MIIQVAGSLVAIAGLIGVARAEEISARPVQRFSDEGELIGASTLIRDFAERRISMNLNTRELRRNAPYTVWWVVFNNPDLCETACECGAADFANAEDIGIGVFWATGSVSDRFGQAVFAAQVDEGELPEGEDQVPYIDGIQFDRPIEDANEAEIHLVVWDHGRRIPSHLEQQITEFDGGCPRNGCVDVQFSAHRSLSCEVP
jgi:hypothetical protein